jgi:chromate transporter
MHRELVERNRWISDRRFLHALNYCMVLPGPEAQQLSIYTGWLLHRIWGAVAAGVLFVLPGALLMWLISMGYVYFGKLAWVDAIFYGLKPAVMAIVAAAVLRIGTKALKNGAMWSIAALAFIAIFFGGVPFPLIILSAGAIGLVGGLFLPDMFDMTARRHQGVAVNEVEGFVIGDDCALSSTRPSWFRSLGTALLWGAIWWAPVLVSWLVLGPQHILTKQGIFFSKVALVMFGGAYAVLPYVAQQAVGNYGWLSPVQMMDGLGLAETTPGPLILVLQFVGFLGGWQSEQSASPLALASLAAFITCWVTFAPGFLFIMVGAPYVERSRDNRRLNTILSAVTAAIVGVVLNLAVWFSWQVALPRPGVLDWIALLLAGLFFVAISWRKWDVTWIVLAGALSGLLLKGLASQLF